MHDAPAVSYPVGRPVFVGTVILATWSLGVAAIGLWFIQARIAPAGLAAALLATAATGVLALRGWLRSPVGILSWNGRGWSWTAQSGTQPGSPEVVLDAQRLLLLRWQVPGSGVCWLWLERAAQPARWDDLRRAVYSRASLQAPSGGQPEGEAKP